MLQVSFLKLIGIVWCAVSILLPVSAFAQKTTVSLSQLKDNVETLAIEYMDANAEATDFMLDEKYEQAVAAFTKTIEQHKKLAEAYQDMHTFLSKNSTNWTKEDEEGYRSIQSEHEKGYADIFNSRGNCYASLNQEELALQDYAEAIKLAPGTGYYHRSMYYMRTGKLEKTKADLTKLLEVAPDSMFAASATEMLGILP